jgi:2-hydroxy-6-oxonona-2,4-dienedioate hydrolase
MSFDNNNNPADNKKNNNNIPPERFIIINGHKIKYLDYNREVERFSNLHSILVLLHGLGASCERWLNVAPMLSKYFRVIIPDIIGFGKSDKPMDKYSIGFLVRFLKEFLDRLNIDRPIILCGHSFGGYLATEFAIAFSNRVEKLVLVAPAGVTQSSTPVLDQYVLAAIYPTYENALKVFVNMTFDPRFVTEDSVRDFIKRMMLLNAKYAFMSILVGIRYSSNLQSRIPKIKSPTLIMWGENDKMTPPPDDKYIQDYSKKISIKKINHCGHIPFVEKPIRFIAMLLKFLLGKDLYSQLYRQMTDQDREKERNMHMCEECNRCAQSGCLVECPPDRCLYDIKTFRISKCTHCQGNWVNL